MAYGMRRHNDDAIWAPLADVMSLVACVFLAIFVIAIGAYLKSESERRQNEDKFRRIGSAAGALLPEIEKANNAFADEAKDPSAGMTIGGDGQLQIREGLLFKTLSAKLEPEGEVLVRDHIAPAIKKALDILKDTPYHRIMIAGHADSRTVESPLLRCTAGGRLPRPKAFIKESRGSVKEGLVLLRQLFTEQTRRKKAPLDDIEPLRILDAEIKDSDDTPPKYKSICYKYLDNWDLSGARAVMVLEAILLARPDIDRTRLYAASFADTQLVKKEKSDDAANRRVEVWVKTDVLQMLKDKGLLNAVQGTPQ